MSPHFWAGVNMTPTGSAAFHVDATDHPPAVQGQSVEDEGDGREPSDPSASTSGEATIDPGRAPGKMLKDRRIGKPTTLDR